MSLAEARAAGQLRGGGAILAGRSGLGLGSGYTGRCLFSGHSRMPAPEAREPAAAGTRGEGVRWQRVASFRRSYF